MSKIIVAGGGTGGLTAAVKLAEGGHSVTVFEKHRRSDSGLPQKDAFDPRAMEYAGFEIPDSFRAENNIITFVPLGEDSPSLTLPRNKTDETLIVERQELFDYLVDKAEAAGVSFHWECEINGPIVLGSRVAGIRTQDGDFYADLIIDACGVHSPVRNALPGFMLTDGDPVKYDVLHAYRAYFKKDKSVPDPEHKYCIYVDHDGTEGFSWAITEEDSVDALIVRFPECEFYQMAEPLRRISERNPQMSQELLRGGRFKDIPVRAPAAVFVADGYAAVGDSAFMTYATKGSGIAYSIKAGVMLARAVEDDSDGLFTAETLWEYEKDFFREIGFDACRIATAKNLLPYITAGEVNDIFAKGLVTSEELAAFMDEGLQAILTTKIVSVVMEKIRVLGDVPEFRGKLRDLLVWVGKWAVTEPSFPNKYEKDEVRKWKAKYDEFFNSIRRSDFPAVSEN